MHPHESPKVMTDPADRAGRRCRSLGGVLLLGDWIVELAGAGRRARSRRASRRSPALVLTADHRSRSSPSASRSPGCMYGRRRGAARWRRRRSRSLTRAARRDLYGDAFNEALFMRPRPVPHPVAGLLRQPRRRRRRQRPGRADRRARPAGSAGCRPASSAPTRSRCSAAPSLVVVALLVVRL